MYNPTGSGSSSAILKLGQGPIPKGFKGGNLSTKKFVGHKKGSLLVLNSGKDITCEVGTKKRKVDVVGIEEEVVRDQESNQLDATVQLTDSDVVVVVDTIDATQTLTDGDTLVSANGTFELGFFSPGSSSLKYLAIRYNQILEKTIAWVANRQTGINTSSGCVLRLSGDGILFLHDGRNTTTSIWSSNTTRVAQDPILQMLDSGNLVVRERNDIDSGNYLWQSFDHQGDTSLTGQKLSVNKKTGKRRSLSCWKTPDDPSPGNYTYGIEIIGLPQIVLRNNSAIAYRSGPWNGLQLSGTPSTRSSSFINISFVSNDEEVYLTSHVINSSTLTRLYLSPQGIVQFYIWTGTWYLNVQSHSQTCDRYRTCGSYGMCNDDNLHMCSCLDGFKPRNTREWEIGTRTGGCVRKTELHCPTDGFRQISGVKVPDTKNFWYNSTINLDECKRLCLKNCTCTAYGNLDVRDGGSGCMQWFGDLLDMKSLPKSEQNIFVRLAASELDATDGGNTNSRKTVGNTVGVSNTVGIAVGVSLSAAILIIGLALYAISRRKHQKSGMRAWRLFREDSSWDLMAETIKKTCNQTEVLRSIHIGLLCVQRNPDDRPSMSAVVLMLGSEGQLPQPKQPGFFTERDVGGGDLSTSSEKTLLANDYAITILDPR
ncbi:hypothetical protein ACFE04_013579 [Oxalis oulophora]